MAEHKKSILYVDDDPKLHIIVQGLAESRGLTFIGKNNLREALEYIYPDSDDPLHISQADSNIRKLSIFLTDGDIDFGGNLTDKQNDLLDSYGYQHGLYGEFREGHMLIRHIRERRTVLGIENPLIVGFSGYDLKLTRQYTPVSSEYAPEETLIKPATPGLIALLRRL